MIEQFPLLAEINPGLWVILAGLICTLLPIGHARKAFVIAAPIFAGLLIFHIHGLSPSAHFGGRLLFGPVELTTLRIDNLSVVWGYLFCLAGVINGIYALHEKCRMTDRRDYVCAGQWR